MNAQHTPGPWKRTHGSGRYYIKTDKQSIATVFSSHGEFGCPTNTTSKQASANARLIAAAPDLLAALQGLDEAYCRAGSPLNKDERHEDRMRLIAARAAIAKATGGGV